MSILEKTEYQHFEILIVDNRSSEAETLEWFKVIEADARVKVIPFDRPFNFSAINNFAVAAHARGEIIGLVNSDLQVIAPAWLSEMVGHAMRAEIGAVGAKLYTRDNWIEHAGITLGIGGVAANSHSRTHRTQVGYFGRAVLIHNCSAVSAACLMVRKAIYDEVEGLDETFAVCYGDVDFCLRIGTKGYRNVFVPDAELYHYKSARQSARQAARQSAGRSGDADRMKQRWGDLLSNDPCYSPNLTLDAGDFALAFPPRAKKPWVVEPDDAPLSDQGR